MGTELIFSLQNDNKFSVKSGLESSSGGKLVSSRDRVKKQSFCLYSQKMLYKCQGSQII